jgi:radical SAM protein (TIGR04043 family)
MDNKMDISDSVVRKKVQLQARGVRVPPELMDELEASYNAPAIRTGRMVLILEAPNGEPMPAFIVNGRRGATSALELAKKESGGFQVLAGGEPYADVSLIARPRFYDSLTADGIPRHKLAVIVGPGHLRSVVNQVCHYQQIGKPCKFCAVQHWWNANIKKASAEIAATVAMAVEEGVVKHVSLTTATLDTPGKGLEDLVQTAQLIHARTDVPLMLEFEPVEDPALLEKLLTEAKEAGVTTVSANIEVFTPELRAEVMPAKGLLPVETYINTWETARRIFGDNEVFTTAVVGAGDDDEALLKGVEMVASHGAMTFLVPHSPAIGAAYEDMEPPDADRMLALYEKAAEIHRQHSLDMCACGAGCVRGSGFSAIKDVSRFGI